jgi:hypothetical protein
MTDFEKPAAPMMFGDSKFRQIMAAAAERGQRDLDEFAKIVTTYGKAMGLVPSLPAADDTDDQVGTILPASISPDQSAVGAVAPRRPRRTRKPTLASVAKQVRKPALDVARYEVKPDGTVVVVTGAPESTEPNPWLADLKGTKQ